MHLIRTEEWRVHEYEGAQISVRRRFEGRKRTVDILYLKYYLENNQIKAKLIVKSRMWKLPSEANVGIVSVTLAPQVYFHRKLAWWYGLNKKQNVV